MTDQQSAPRGGAISSAGSARRVVDERLAFASPVHHALMSSETAVAVTGAGGWLGRATLEMLEESLGREGLRDRVAAYGSTRRTMQLRSGTVVRVEPLSELAGNGHLGSTPHLLAHYAFLTREHVKEMPAADYLARNRAISDALATHAVRAPVAGIFVPSSGAVYRPDRSLADDLAENPYGALKLADERRFLDLAARPGGPGVVVFRLFNLSGPFLNKAERYVLGSILTDIARGGPVRLLADHPVVRSYVHVRDVVDLAFAAMLGVAPLPPGPVDTASDREVEIGELAQLALEVLGRPHLLVDRPPLTGPADRYVGDGTAFAELAAAVGVVPVPLRTQVADTAAYLGVVRAR